MTTIFILLLVYQLKHFLADYPLQSFSYFLGKFKKDWGFFEPLLAHAATHGWLSAIICVTAGLTYSQAVVAGLFDLIVHFTMDRIKAGPKYMGRWKPLTASDYMSAAETLQLNPPTRWWRTSSEPGDAAKRLLRGNILFWNCLGIDQMVHHLTHYAIIWYIVKHVRS